MARKLETLQDLYLDELRDLYHAETQLVRALPQMAQAAQSCLLRRCSTSEVVGSLTLNHALHLSRRERHGCNRGVPCAGSPSLDR